jgi:hypothetical protein
VALVGVRDQRAHLAGHAGVDRQAAARQQGCTSYDNTVTASTKYDNREKYQFVAS